MTILHWFPDAQRSDSVTHEPASVLSQIVFLRRSFQNTEESPSATVGSADCFSHSGVLAGLNLPVCLLPSPGSHKVVEDFSWSV